MRRIGYAKTARSLTLDGNAGFQGNLEAYNFLVRMATRHPDVEFVLIGRHTKITAPLPKNVISRWDDGEEAVVEDAMNLDGAIVHVGQHGTSHIRIPFVGEVWDQPGKKLTDPLQFAQNYGRATHRVLNAMGDRTDGKAPVAYIVTDPRNYLKARDIKWPTGTKTILAQGTGHVRALHQRYRDTRTPEELGFEGQLLDDGTWDVQHRYVFGGLETMIIDDAIMSFETRPWANRVASIGVTTTASHHPTSGDDRARLLNRWLPPGTPVYGKWDAASLKQFNGEVTLNNPSDFNNLLGSFIATVALPPLVRRTGDGMWTTSKPLQAFAVGTPCFFLGSLDSYGWLVPSRTNTTGAHQLSDDGLFSPRTDWDSDALELARFLRVESPDDMQRKVYLLRNDHDLFNFIVAQQKRIVTQRVNEQLPERLTEWILGL